MKGALAYATDDEVIENVTVNLMQLRSFTLYSVY